MNVGAYMLGIEIWELVLGTQVFRAPCFGFRVPLSRALSRIFDYHLVHTYAHGRPHGGRVGSNVGISLASQAGREYASKALSKQVPLESDSTPQIPPKFSWVVGSERNLFRQSRS